MTNKNNFDYVNTHTAHGSPLGRRLSRAKSDVRLCAGLVKTLPTNFHADDDRDLDALVCCSLDFFGDRALTHTHTKTRVVFGGPT